MAQVVGGELRLVTAGIHGPLGRGRQTCVVDEDMQRTTRAVPAGREGVDRRRVKEVQRTDLHALKTSQRRGGTLRVTRPDGDGSPGLAERAGGLQADPGVSAGDDDVFAGEIEARQDLVGGGSGGEAGAKGTLQRVHGITILCSESWTTRQPVRSLACGPARHETRLPTPPR